MDFNYFDKQTISEVLIPEELIGYWYIRSRRYEFRADGRYYVHELNTPYQLIESGMTLVYNGIRFKRLYGDPSGLPGVWLLESDTTEEWNIRSDGTYTWHWPGYEYFGEYLNNETVMSTCEMRAVLSESTGILTFDPPYAPSVSGVWNIDEPKLTIAFPSGDVIYTRDPK